uniref:AP complex mu/sigma subunit domain-containing protein n=1 Tax=Ursus americanus TaxID=9643 RepID=A0A452SN82_URSAM
VIRVTLIFNNLGKQWLSAYYLPDCEDPQQQTIRETFHLVPKKDENVCKPPRRRAINLRI